MRVVELAAAVDALLCDLDLAAAQAAVVVAAVDTTEAVYVVLCSLRTPSTLLWRLWLLWRRYRWPGRIALFKWIGLGIDDTRTIFLSHLILSSIAFYVNESQKGILRLELYHSGRMVLHLSGSCNRAH